MTKHKKLFLLFLTLTSIMNCGKLGKLEGGIRDSNQQNYLTISPSSDQIPNSSDQKNHLKRICLIGAGSFTVLMCGMVSGFFIGKSIENNNHNSCHENCNCDPVFQFRGNDSCPEGYDAYVAMAGASDIYKLDNQLVANVSVGCANQNDYYLLGEYVMRYLGCLRNIDTRAINGHAPQCCSNGNSRIQSRKCTYITQPNSRGRGREKHRR